MKTKIVLLIIFLIFLSLKIIAQPIANFEIEPPPYCENQSVQFTNTSQNADHYYWDFGDGTYSTEENPSHSYEQNDIFEYTIILTAYDTEDNEDTYSKTITITELPIAKFYPVPKIQEYPSTVIQIENQSSPDYDMYLWNFGDGNNEAQENFIEYFTYDYFESKWGTYIITLKVWDNGCFNEYKDTVIITAPLPINWSMSYDVCENIAIDFYANVNYTTPGVSKYKWILYEKYNNYPIDTIYQENFSYTFVGYGTYLAELFATAEGCDPPWSFQYIKTDTINIYEKPVADFDIATNRVYLPYQPVLCRNVSQNADSYLWYFGNGETSKEDSPEYYYLDDGEYYISLVAKSKNNCSDSLTNKYPIIINNELLVFPNAFIPTNGQHPAFRPIYKGEFIKYELKIINRQGEIVFQTNNIDDGWDGTFKGKLCPSGGYQYIATGEHYNNRPFKIWGTLILLK